MLGKRKLVLDTWCEVYDLLKPWADAEFSNLQEHLDNNELVVGATYLIGREQVRLNPQRIRDLVTQDLAKVVFSNPAEGSLTIINHCKDIGIMDLVEQKKLFLLVGGDVPEHLPHLFYENFLPKILDYNENLQAICDYQERFGMQRPYKFLFLNGRARWHRTYLLVRLASMLDQCLWTNLDNVDGPIKLLDQKYEVPRFAKPIDISKSGCVKNELFGLGIWGDIIMCAEPYLDTYFSLVTETVYSVPYSFRTEKIWKPVAIGHPWIVAASQGYYRDMRNLGFRTFNHLIDESFDQIENNRDRLDRTVEVIKDLCKQDLSSFLAAAQETCKYNQQRLVELRTEVRNQFPGRFFEFARRYQLDE